MNKRNKKHLMGLPLISAGFLFFFLPDFTVLDILPDLIGYLLISSGLTKFSDMYEELAEAKKLFSRLALLGVAKLLSVFIVFGVSDGVERPTTILMAMFIISAAELIMIIPAYIKLFDGITYMGTREDGVSVFRKSGEKHIKKRSYTDRIKRSTLIFVVVKNFLAVLPEMLALSGVDTVQSYNYSRYDFINHFRVISMTIILITGIVWVIKIRKYFSALKKDIPFIERLNEKYNKDVFNVKTRFVVRRIKNSLLVFGLGAVLALDLYIDGNAGFNLIPDFFAAVCFIVAAIMIGDKKCIYKIMTVTSAAAYAIISIVSYVFINYFNSDFHPKDVSRKVLAFNRWGIALTISAAEAVCFIIMVASVSMLLYQVVKKHCGYIPIHESIDPVSKSKEIYARLRKYICLSFSFGALAGIAIFFRVLSFRINAISEWSWMIELAFEIIFAITFISALYKINEEVEEKYHFS